jgi:glycosyltransferase involved in cell wall biosynthesis
VSGSTFLVHLADQRRSRTDSHGIINFSLGLTRALPAALAADERLVVLVNDELAAELDGLRLRPHDRLEVVAAPATALHRLWLDHVGVVRRGRRADVVLYPKGFLPLLSRFGGAAQVPVFHDDIPLRMLREQRTLRRWLRAAYFSGLLVRSVRTADARCFVSAFTAGRLARFGGRRERSDTVVHEGIALPAAPFRPVAERQRQALVLGSTHPHKRIEPGLRLARASAPLGAAVDRIVLVGPAPPGGPAAGQPPVDHVRGPVSSQALAELVASSRVLLYPSAYEGFGLPPVEALALGTPVVHRATEAGDEVLGPMPGRFAAEVQPDFDAAVVEALAMTDDDLLATRDRMWATYDWAPVADRVATALRQAAVAPGRRRPARR